MVEHLYGKVICFFSSLVDPLEASMKAKAASGTVKPEAAKQPPALSKKPLTGAKVEEKQAMARVAFNGDHLPVGSDRVQNTEQSHKNGFSFRLCFD